jgi:hypothetical protein
VEKEKQEAETEQQPGTSQKPGTSGETGQVVVIEEEEKAAIPSKTTRSESEKVNNFIPLCS